MLNAKASCVFSFERVTANISFAKEIYRKYTRE
uniref:Uncharacterized protein n=1 Tax=Marseillevirus sp. TaxID=2809551 RepID=A0AA96ELX0_9VIRU|nr:hypothetical protein MarDSR_053 [Marseillevirus sp.]